MANIIVEKLDTLFGDPSEKYIKKLQPQVDAINALEKEYETISDEGLKENDYLKVKQ
jgi:preprotein translocase subunit SecA